MALYQAGDVGRRWDPQLAAVYYRQMVYHGKNHRQAMGAVMSHLGARVLRVLKEDRPYELKGPDGKAISWIEGRKLILSEYHVPEDIRRERRRRNIKNRQSSRIRKSGDSDLQDTRGSEAPQPVKVEAVSR